MKATAKIIKIEDQGEGFCVTLELPPRASIEDFDINQIAGFDCDFDAVEKAGIDHKSANDWAGGVATVWCKKVGVMVGDSITDEKDGEPVRGEVRKGAVPMRDVRDQDAVRANEEARGEFHAKYGSRDSKENRKA